MSEAHEAAQAHSMLEWMGFDRLSDYCTMPDCYCDGSAHPEPGDSECSEADL